MRRVSFALTLLLGLLAITPAYATTAYYQPTPFPLKKMNGSSMPQDLDKVHIWDGYVGSVYSTTFTRNERLTVGGWGDWYNTYLTFDLTGLPATVTNAILWLRPTGTDANQTPFAVCPVTSSWTYTMTWGTRPSTPTCYGWFTMPAPGNWWGLTVTNWYTGWKNSPSTNYGVRIAPQNNANTFDTFISSRNMSDGYRPILQLDFTPPSGMPSFKMPLPGGATWLLTNEIGGYECMGEAPWPDTAHQGNSYFSIDISPTNKKDGGGSYGGDIPVLAAANGRVAAIGTDPSAANGYYITLNHSGLTSTTSGYTTKYIHLKNPPVLAVGVSVQQGDQIGIMGNTGNPTTGRHLHFGVYYDGSGASTKNELTYVTVDGWLMKSFQTECSVNSSGVPTGRIRYYHSSNRTY